MEAWLSAFRDGVFVLLAPEDRAQTVEETLALLWPVLCDATATGRQTMFGCGLRPSAGRVANMK
jgi:hypothetical protein